MPDLIVHHLRIGQGERIPFLLEELEIPYTLKIYPRAPLFAGPELKALYPMGAAPVLEDATDNAEQPIKFAESGAIMEYIIYKYGSGRLALAPSHANYADYLYWFHFANGTLQPTLARLLTARMSSSSDEDASFRGQKERTLKAVAHFDNRLKSHDYLAGTEFTAADIVSLWSFTTWRAFAALDLTDFNGIVKWMERCTERPAYQRAMGKAEPGWDWKSAITAKGPPLNEHFAKVLGGR